jgi:2-methylisocitrate lyase-like PEP mutase family enzyme
MRQVGKAIPKALKANLSDAGKTPTVSYDDLYEMGFKVINYSGLLQRTAIKGMLDVLEILKREGTTASAYPSMICNLADRSELLGLAELSGFAGCEVSK